MHDFKRIAVLAVAGAGALAALSIAARGGPLTPPAGTVGPTGRTLEEIYNRIPATGGFDGRIPIPGGTAQVSITQPGSYVLTGNITSSTIGISVSVLNGPVTIDLNGFTVSSTSSSSQCINVSNGAQFRLRNGTVSGCNFGISLSNAPGAVIEDVTVTGVKGIGINVPTSCPGSTLRRCTLVDIGSLTTAADTSVVTGINCSAMGCRIEECTLARLLHNGTSPGPITGIQVTGQGGLVNRCIVANTVSIAGSFGMNFASSSTSMYTGNNVHGFATEYNFGVSGGGNN